MKEQADIAVVEVETPASRGSGWWRALSPATRRVVATTGVVMGLGIVGYSTYRVLRWYFRRGRALKEGAKAFGEDRHATWANQFKMAFDNDGLWGTMVEKVRQVMREIPSKEDYNKTATSFALQEGKSLATALEEELTTTEFTEMLAIYNSKPEKASDVTGEGIYDPDGWARRLNAAVNYTVIGFWPATDEDAIEAVFAEMPNRTAFDETAEAYLQLYGLDLEEELDGDYAGWRDLLKA